ncbi:copper chaperone PCu(A)C [Streptomyces sp. YIM S03343]
MGAALTGALLLTGCGGGSGDSADGSGSGSGSSDRPELSVSSSYMPRPVTSDMAAGFLTIVNKGGTKDELTSVTSDAAGSVTLHETTGQAMNEVTSLTVPAHGQLVFKSGGYHLMFEKLKQRPEQGRTVTLKLHFATSDPLTVEMPVKPATYNPATGH